jgi:hypothetical protein
MIALQTYEIREWWRRRIARLPVDQLCIASGRSTQLPSLQAVTKENARAFVVDHRFLRLFYR